MSVRKQAGGDDTSALADIRVLDLSTGIAAPVASMFLGDFGADVIKVASPEPDVYDSLPGAAVWNRNKRSVVIDSTVEADRDWLVAAIGNADVCILGAADSLAAWGPEVESAAAANIRLIELRMPPYLDGYAPWEGESNGLLAAYGGQAMRQSSVAGGPIETMSPYLLYIHGVWAAACLVAALVERTVSGLGQVVTVTGVQGLIEATVTAMSVDPTLPDPSMKVGPAGRHPTYRQFRCSDGTWISCGALGPKFETGLLKALGLDDILADPRIDGVSARMALTENFEWCLPKLVDAFASRTREESLALLSSIGIPCGPAMSREEWLDHPQIRGIGMRVEIDDPARGRVVMPGSAINLTRTPARFDRHAPSHGEHNGATPWSARPVSEEPAPRFVEGPLAGFRVLNMGTFVASPYAGFLLKELGADVIKVEPLTGDPFRGSGYAYNRGMRSLAIDLKSEAGQGAFHRLVKVSDVVIDGMRPGVMSSLNIDYEKLAEINQNIVTMSLSAYGEGGPLSQAPGVDMVVQAMSGMMTSWGGEDDPVANTIAINDVTAAALSALTCVLALYDRQQTGRGQRTWDSLAAVSVFLQMGDMVKYDGRPELAVGRSDLRGLSPVQSYYETSDGWIYVDSTLVKGGPAAATSMLVFAELINSDTSSGDMDAVRESLAKSLRELTSEEAVAAVSAAGLRAVQARPLSSVLRDPRLLDAEAVHVRTADDKSSFMMTARYAGFSRTQRRGPLSPDGVGQSTVAVLTEAGFDDDEITALLEVGAVRTGGPVQHVLPIAYR
ncbi:CoA transferase [Salinibacterium sp. SWN167]|uniref:CaiB/BaiF CoA-transferase family protein n=1 Tax=Salinibacterium sp. SWN167 TaxID=2792054 RepID=UPI0018CE4704|nr:CoA transferase [Salinibacterium sp. SWN167]MBH0084034.1 CoA transferase [Salinibacterium sp. SWN167]